MRHWYMDGTLYVVVELGAPTAQSLVGVGHTMANAVNNLEATPIQCVGRDSGLESTLKWAENAGWFTSDLEDFVEEDDDFDTYHEDPAFHGDPDVEIPFYDDSERYDSDLFE